MLLGALKNNVLTRGASKQELEADLATWFGNARDRGHGKRRILNWRSRGSHNEEVSESHGDSPSATNNDNRN